MCKVKRNKAASSGRDAGTIVRMVLIAETLSIGDYSEAEAGIIAETGQKRRRKLLNEREVPPDLKKRSKP